MSDLHERDVLRSLAQQGPEAEPDYHQIIMTGMARGRRRRLVRRVLQGIAGTGVAAAVGATAFAVTSFPVSTPTMEIAPAGGGPSAKAKPTKDSQDQAQEEARKRAEDATKGSDRSGESVKTRDRSALSAEDLARKKAAAKGSDTGESVKTRDRSALSADDLAKKRAAAKGQKKVVKTKEEKAEAQKSLKSERADAEARAKKLADEKRPGTTPREGRR